MKTLRQHLKQSLTLFIFIAAFSSYSNVFAETPETTQPDIQHHTQHKLWPGVYHGFLPCDDCKGVKISLAMNKNNSYLLISQYVGKSEKEIVEKGKFDWGNQENTVVLTPRKGSQTRQYLIDGNTLIQLDSNGNQMTGADANRYILRKTEMEQKSQTSSHH